MFSFLADFMRNAGHALDVILLDEDGLETPRRYRIHPAQIIWMVGAFALVVGLVLLLLVVMTPVRGMIPGLATSDMREDARMNADRLQALEDSLQTQTAYLDHLKDLMLGRVTPISGDVPPESGDSDTDGLAAEPSQTSEGWEDGGQPSVSLVGSLGDGDFLPVVMGSGSGLSAPRFPVLPPVDGFMTRGFVPEIGHYALDIAVTAGTVVRAVSAGYVVMADWTHDGGYVLAVQHTGGYLSVYKHNQRLLKRAGDRVSAREPITISGNTGEVTSGPHLHFELWRDGLAQDPMAYLLDL
ncbi:MAG: hypothetical protein ACI80V_002578 [Rhodothermales bacterium]|jgi:hypothetical protein